MSLRFLPAARPGAPEAARVAFTTARGGAVTRNRIRRRLRAAVASHESALVPGAAYLFGSGPDAATAPFPTLVDAVGRLAAEAAQAP